MKVVIVGGGIAAVGTAGALRAGGFDGEITLVDAGEFPYDRPPLSKNYLSGAKGFEQIALQSPRWYDEQDVRLLNLTTVTAVRARDTAVELGDGTLLPADRVVLATGGTAARPPIPGGDDERVHVLRTAGDADRLRRALRPGARVLVVGAGLIGAEVASTAVGLGCEAVLADPVEVPQAAALGAELAAWLHGRHTVRGVAVLRAGVESFTAVSGGIEAHFTGGEEPRAFDAVVLGVGMVPRTDLAASAGLLVEHGILVDARQVTSNPGVLAVGDCALPRPAGGGVPRAGHWEAARQDAARAAAALLGAPAPAPAAPWFWTDRHGNHVEAVGHMNQADLTVVRGDFGKPPFSVFGLRAGLVVAAAAVDDSAAVRAARKMLDRRVPAVPDRLSDPSENLRRLARG